MLSRAVARARDVVTPFPHEAASKSLVIAVAVAALVLMALLGVREWAAIWPLTIGAFGVSALLSRLTGTFGIWPALLIAFVHPALFLAMRGQGRLVYVVVWFGAMLGALLARSRWDRWALPFPWKLPVVFWGLVVAVSWPLLIAREMHFDPTLLDRFNTASSLAGGPVPLVAIWISTVVLTNLVAILFFDWCFEQFAPAAGGAFVRRVVAPLSISASLGAALAIYQGAVDVTFWSGHQWPLHNRAAGGLVDGDAFGALAGFWSAASVALLSGAGPLLAALGALGVITNWAGLWASGSRMALVAGVIGATVTLAGLAASFRRWSWRFRLISIVVVALALALPAVADFNTANPLERIVESLPRLNRADVLAFAESQLFNRGAPFGTATVRMIGEFPVSGIGLSSFVTMFPDYAYIIERTPAIQENAQSWYRQQAAELGVVGSIGWIVWLWLCLLLVGRAVTRTGTLAAYALTGALISVACVCAISLPTQNPVVSFSVWVFVAWLALIVGPFPPDSWTVRWLRPTPGRWRVVWVLLLVFATSTLVSALGRLSVPARAVAADWTYSTGFYPAEVHEGRLFRWTEQRAIEVVATHGPWLKLTIGGGPDDLATDPQRLRVWRDDVMIIDHLRASPATETWYVGVRSMGRPMIIRIEVDRTWTGGSDPRRFGVSVGPWDFVTAPPEGANVIR